MDLDALRSTDIDVIDAPLHLNGYRRDLWPRDTLSLLEHGDRPPPPLVVVSPRKTEEVTKAIEWANKEGVTVVPYGAGSGVCGGAQGRAGSMVVDLKRLNRIRQISPASRTAWIEAGILGQHLEDQLASIGWMTAHSPSSIACSTAGGYLAARSAGQFSSRYGVFDDMTLAAHAETPAGPLDCGLWTPPGTTDLLPILTGSEGGLGVVTDMLVRIHPTPDYRWLRGFAFETVEDAWLAMRRLMQADLWPSVVRLYDPVDTKIGGKTKASDAKAGGGLFGWLKSAASNNPALSRHMLSLPLALPGLLNHIGKQLSNEVLLIVGFEGPLPVVNAAVEASRPIFATGRDLGTEPGEQWYSHRHDVSYKLAPVFIAGAFADTMEVAASWDRLPDLYANVQRALGRHTVVMAHFSHAYPEGCSIYFSFAGRGNLDVYDKTWEDALKAVRDAGGTVTHHHGVGTLKAQAAAKEAGAAIRVWRDVKNRLDPNGIMNPGRPFPVQPTEVEEEQFPSPSGGPVFHINSEALMAKVDPFADPKRIQDDLASHGYMLRLHPDRPLNDWLQQLQRGALEVWQTPLFGVQARFEDGVAARIFCAPRSAAGPDLRWSLLRSAKAEWVEVPIRIQHNDMTVGANHPNLDVRDVRPAWHSDEIWGFSEAQNQIAEQCFLKPSSGAIPSLAPEPSE